MTTAKPKIRDLRLDFFRGLAMLVIFIAHVPGNSWNGFIPARFGFSNATEMFVFGSGFASALAFGSVFVRRGWWLGLARILHRCWQVYWAHIGLFLIITALYVQADGLWPDVGYLRNQGLKPLVEDPARALVSMLTLRWQADYLDILPMYLVILLLIPLMMLARRVHALAPFGLSAALYGAAWFAELTFVANPWTGRTWYFDPFAWQLIFFTGFAFGAKWLAPVRLRQPMLLWVAGVYLAVAMIISFWGFQRLVPELEVLQMWLLPPGTQQTNLHPLRIIHFLALAYAVLSLIEPFKARIGAGFSKPIVTVGQQSLATFLASLFLARLAGLALDHAGRGEGVVAIVNSTGLLAVVIVAYIVAWFKSAPWSGPGAPRPVVVTASSTTALPAPQTI
jgi:hypothetical protein